MGTDVRTIWPRMPVAHASVLVAGAGPVGLVIGLHLAAGGVGAITLWDSGLVTPQDFAAGLVRDPLCVGLPRASCAAGALRAAFPGAGVSVLDRESDVIGAVPEHDLVITGADVLPGLVDAASRSGLQVIAYRVSGHVGWAALLPPGARLPITALPAGAGLEASQGAPGVIGALVAAEAVKLLQGRPSHLTGRALIYNAEHGEVTAQIFAESFASG